MACPPGSHPGPPTAHPQSGVPRAWAAIGWGSARALHAALSISGAAHSGLRLRNWRPRAAPRYHLGLSAQRSTAARDPAAASWIRYGVTITVNESAGMGATARCIIVQVAGRLAARCPPRPPGRVALGFRFWSGSASLPTRSGSEYQRTEEDLAMLAIKLPVIICSAKVGERSLTPPRGVTSQIAG